MNLNGEQECAIWGISAVSKTLFSTESVPSTKYRVSTEYYNCVSLYVVNL